MSNCVFCNSGTSDSVRVGCFDIAWIPMYDVLPVSLGYRKLYQKLLLQPVAA